jgi:single-strand DNA-binding protein
MNTCTFSGRLAADPELKTVGSNDLLSFRIPVEDGFGEKKTTTWVACSLWGVRAQKLAPMLSKGTFVIVSGSFSTREWTDKEGKTRTSVELRVSELTLGPKQSAAQAQPAAGAASQLADEIPF